MSTEHIKQAQRTLGVTADGHFGQHTLEALLDKVGQPVDKTQGLAKGMLSPNFSLAELTRSNTAAKYGINNTPSGAHLANLRQATLNLFQPVRELLDNPMLISSGYRSTALNKRVGGASGSAHSYGFAIDFTCPDFGSTIDIAEYLAKELPKRGIKFDQIILEYPDKPNSWVHLGYKRGSDGAQRGQLLTKKVGTRYMTGLIH